MNDRSCAGVHAGMPNCLVTCGIEEGLYFIRCSPFLVTGLSLLYEIISISEKNMLAFTQKGEALMEILKCEGVRKVYGTGSNRVTALNGIDLSVEKGEFVAIVGASGSGKSTLLHILGSVDRPTEGKVLVEGTDISVLNRTQAAIFRRRKVGLVYQFYNLIPTLTVRKNILMPLLLDKRKVDPKYFEKVVNALGIADKLEFLPGQLSGGQQQRAAIARSLIYRPALLLADEPTGNLDRKNSQEIIDMLKISNRSLQQTVLLITHDEKLALEADRIITIEDGQIVSDQKRG